MIWRTRPIFVSSTFNDFQAERDLLQDLVFPDLAERLRERGHDLEPIDLRLGVETASEADEIRKTLLVVKVCIQEALRSRPFMIVLVGGRSGALVPADRVQRALEDAGIAGDPTERSITELEIDFGLLAAAAREQVRTVAYFRSLDGVPDDQQSRYQDPDQSRVERLKRALQDRLGPDRCRAYRATWDAGQHAVAGLEEFRTMVLEDLWRDLDEVTRPYLTVAETSEDRERAALQGFLHDAARDFTGREALLTRLSSLTQSESGASGMCVVGGPGSGKSSVAAQLIRRLRQVPSILLLEHAAGISADSVRVDRLLQRWSAQLKRSLGDEEPLRDDLGGDELEAAFARLLARAAHVQRTVLVVDALNEFERTTRARNLTWLPRIWPANATLIATAIPGSETDAFTRRKGFELVELPPLSGNETDQIVDAVYRRYRRQPNLEVKAAILSKRTEAGEPASANPLWLELACEEMNLLDPEDYIRAQRIEAPPDRQIVLMQLDLVARLPSTGRAMYSRMLKRSGEVATTILSEQRGAAAAERTGENWARQLAQSIAISRDGWRDRDLQSVLPGLTDVPWTELLFASVRRTYRGHLTQRGLAGQWSFYHQELRRAVSDHFASPPQELRRLHAAYSAHLETLALDDPLRQTELMHHLIGADDQLAAARLFALSEHGSVELRAQTESLADLFRSRDDAGQWVAGLLRRPELSVEERVLLSEKFAYPLHDELAKTGNTQARTELLQAVHDEAARLEQLPLPDPKHGLAARTRSVSMLRLADLSFDVGNTSQARSLYDEVLERDERSATAQRDSFLARQDLVVALERLADLARREGDIGGARKYLERGVALDRHLTEITPDDRWSHGYLGSALERLGLLELDEGDIADAERYLGEAAREHDLAAADTEQRPSLASLQILGRLARAKGEIPEAQRRYRTYEERLRRRAEAAPEDVEAQVAWARSLDQLGDVAMSQRQWTEADELYNQELAIVERLATLLPDDVAAQHQLSLALEKLGDCALQSGEMERAGPRFERSMAIRRRLSELLPRDLPTLRDLGLAHERLGMLEDQPVEGRLKHLEEAIAIYTQLHERLPGNEEAARTLALGQFAFAQALATIPSRRFDAHAQAARAHELLSDLRAAGQVLELDAKRLLAFLDTQFGGTGRWTHAVARVDEATFGELNFLGMAGAQAVAAGDLQTARDSFRKSLDLAREIGHPPSLARSYGSLGEVEGKLGNTRAAVDLLEKAIALARDNDLPAEEGTSLDRLAELYANIGDHERSLTAYEARVSVARRAGDQRGLAMGLANLGVTYVEAGNMPTALSHLQVAARIFKAEGMKPELARTYRYIGACYVNLRDPDKAMAAYREHIAICQGLGDVRSAALSMVNLSTLLYMTGAHDEAIETGQQACRLLQDLGMAESGEVCSQIETWKKQRAGGPQKRWRRTRR